MEIQNKELWEFLYDGNYDEEERKYMASLDPSLMYKIYREGYDDGYARGEASGYVEGWADGYDDAR